MALLRYFKHSIDGNLPNPSDPPPGSFLTKVDIEKANSKVKGVLIQEGFPVAKRGKYENYSSEERASIGKYAALHGATKASKHYSKAWGRKVPESTARHLKKEYNKKLKEVIRDSSSCSVN